MVHPRFLALPEEKHRRLLNAGYQVFGLNEYKKASTEEIARLAGISKGYLFYYFQNKKALYLYLYERATEEIRAQVMDQAFARITDLFDMMACSVRRKAALMAQYPYLMDFAMRAYASQGEAVSADLDRRILSQTQSIYAYMLANLDTRPFKPGIDPLFIARMLQWMAGGWLREVQRQGVTLSPEHMLAEYSNMLRLMRQMSYKEECL